MIEIFFYTLATIIIMFLLGSGLTLLAVPKQLQKYAFWLTPWYFIFFIIFTLTTFSLLGFSVKDIGPFVILFLIGISIYVWKKTSRRFEFSLKQDVLLLFFIVISITLNLSPLIRRQGFLTTVSMGNNDVIIYAVAPEFLLNYSFQENLYLETSPGVSGFLNSGYRWGTPIIESFFLYVFNFLGYQFTYTLEVIIYALSIPLAYILLQILFRKSTIALIILSLLFVFNSNMLYMVYHVFFGQVLFWGLTLSILIVLFSYFITLEKNKRNNLLYEATLGLAIVVFYFSYHEPAIFIFGPIVLFLIYLFVRKKRFLIYLQSIMKIGFIAILLGSVSIINATIVDYLQAFGGDPNAKIGWGLFRDRLPYANPFEMMGFWSIHNFEPLIIPLATVLSLITVFIFIYGFSESKKKDLLLCYISVFLFFIIWMGPIKRNFFAYNRAVTYTLPLFLIIFTIGLTKLIEKGKVIKLIIFSSFVLVIFSGLKLNKRFLQEHVAVDKSYVSLKELPSNIDEPIYTESYVRPSIPLWKNIWSSYFVYPHILNKLYPNKVLNNQYANSIPDNSLVLLEKPVPWYPPTNVLLRKKVWENEFYTLGRICNTANCLITSKEDLSLVTFNREDFQDSILINGWWSKEDGHRWIGLKEATMRLVVKNDPVSILHMEMATLKEPQTMTVYVNEEKVTSVSIKTEWKDYPISIGQHHNEVINIRLEFSHLYNPAALGLSADVRDLVVDVRKISLE